MAETETAVHTPDARRETGVVMAVKEAYGFIRCAEREDKVFFHFSELLNVTPNHEVERGDEVSFIVTQEPDSGRFSAVQVQLLEPGSVLFELIADTDSFGIIERELQGQQRGFGRRLSRMQQEPYGGRIRVLVSELGDALIPSDVVQFSGDDAVLLEFCGRDLVDPRVSLMQGDRVSFRLFTERRSGRQGATAVSLVQAGGDRECGVVVSVKESYGFLKCADRDYKQMFFHFSELVDPDAQLQPGVELEFSIALNKKGQLHATRVIVLEPGTVKFSVVEEQSMRGVVDQGIKHSRTQSSKTRRTSRGGSRDIGFVKVTNADDDEEDASSPPSEPATVEPVAIDQADALATETMEATVSSAPISRIISPVATFPKPKHEKTYSFCGSDLVQPRIELMQGDEVEFKMSIDKRTRQVSATRIVLVTPSPNGRERGVVCVVKPQYGFVKCEKRPDPLFFHFNEIISGESNMQIGDEIEFNVQPDNRGQDNATRIMPLARGSVLFDFLELTGVVNTSSAGATSSDAAIVGTLTLTDESAKQLQCQQASAAVIAAAATVGGNADSPVPTSTPPEHIYSFFRPDMRNANYVFKAGDEVGFTFRRDPSANPDDSRISNLHLLPKHGVVEKVLANGGTIRLGSETGEFIGFNSKDVANGVSLHVGDEVTVNNLTFNSSTQQRIGRGIERTKEAVVEPLAMKMDGLSLQKRVGSSNRVRQIVRMARGPDGSRGFAAGRGSAAAAPAPAAAAEELLSI